MEGSSGQARPAQIPEGCALFRKSSVLFQARASESPEGFNRVHESMAPSPLRILHISDLHAAGPRKQPWRWQRVLGDAWKRNLDELLEEGAFDLVCFTGDVANWGKADEYAQAG